MKVFAAILSLALLASPAAAQVMCGPHATAVKMLENKYQEAPQMRLTLANGETVEIWVNTGTGTWTMLLLRGEGVSCIAGSGEGFSIIRDLSGRES